VPPGQRLALEEPPPPEHRVAGAQPDQRPGIREQGAVRLGRELVLGLNLPASSV